MEPFIALGLTGADVIIDKHFHKMPNKALDPSTYKPKNIHLPRRRKSRRNSKDNRSDEGTESDQDTDSRSLTPQAPPEYESDVATNAGYSYVPPDTLYTAPSIYSREPLHPRPEYLPPPRHATTANRYYSPPPSADVPRMAMNRGRDVDIYDDTDYHSDSYHTPRRPKAVTRRSSSHHVPRDRGSYIYDQQVARRRHGSGSDRLDRYSDKAKDTAHRYKLKEDINGVFTASKTGLTGGAVGALVGGWAAQKAQIGYRKEGHKHDPNPLLTIIGATAGGLAVNAVVDKWQAGKKEGAKREEKREDKFESEDHSDGGRSQRSHKSRHRSLRDSSD